MDRTCKELKPLSRAIFTYSSSISSLDRTCKELKLEEAKQAITCDILRLDRTCKELKHVVFKFCNVTSFAQVWIVPVRN